MSLRLQQPRRTSGAAPADEVRRDTGARSAGPRHAMRTTPHEAPAHSDLVAAGVVTLRRVLSDRSDTWLRDLQQLNGE